VARPHRILYWDPEVTGAWEAGNSVVARRNLLWIVACDHIVFGTWTLWAGDGAVHAAERVRSLRPTSSCAAVRWVTPG
jgi:hypothetical protein